MGTKARPERTAHKYQKVAEEEFDAHPEAYKGWVSMCRKGGYVYVGYSPQKEKGIKGKGDRLLSRKSSLSPFRSGMQYYVPCEKCESLKGYCDVGKHWYCYQCEPLKECCVKYWEILTYAGADAQKDGHGKEDVMRGGLKRLIVGLAALMVFSPGLGVDAKEVILYDKQGFRTGSMDVRDDREIIYKDKQGFRKGSSKPAAGGKRIYYDRKGFKVGESEEK